MRAARAAVAAVLASLTLAGCGGASAAARRGSPPWQRYQAPEHGYAVDYPAAPEVVDDDRRDSKIQISMVGDKAGKRVLGVVTVSADKLHTDASDFLFDAMGAQLGRLFAARVGASTDLLLDGRHARDFELTHLEQPNTRGKGRLVLDADKGRMYFIVLIAETAAGRADLERFFKSFTITE